MGGLFKITLLAYSQQGWKSSPETPQKWEVFGTKIDPRSRKSALEIITKIRLIFHQIFLSILAPFWTPRATLKFIIFYLILVLVGPSWRQEGAQSVPRQLQRSIFLEFGRRIDFGWVFEDFWTYFDTSRLVFDATFYTTFKQQCFSSRF